MKRMLLTGSLLFASLYAAWGGTAAAEASEAKGFRNYGMAAPVAQYAWGGPNAVEDSQGNSLVLLPFILPSNALLVIDAKTGETEQFDVDYPEGVHYMRYHVLSADGRRWYTTVGRSLREFDIDKREWTLVADIPFPSAQGRRDGRGMFADENGIIWIVFSPTSELVSFDPQSRELKYHGSMNDESWSQMPDGLAMDDHGWIYAAIKFQKGNLVGYHPASGERRQMLDEKARGYAAGHDLYRADNGRVYGRLRGKDSAQNQWYELYDGVATPVAIPPARRLYHSQGLKDPRAFPNGDELADYSLIHDEITIRDGQSGKVRKVPFDYSVGSGANIYSLTKGEDGMIYGSTGTPLVFFRFNPQSGVTERIGSLGNHGGHVNDMIAANGRIYGAVYSSGSLIAYDPAQPWDEADIRRSRNPEHLYGYGKGRDLWGRPYALHAHPDGRHIIMTGNPSRALAGGGMLIFDTESGSGQVVTAAELVPDQGPMVVKTLADGTVVGGTTTQAGTTGKRVAKEAELFLYDWAQRKRVFHTVPVPGALAITDLVVGDNGLVYGFTRGRVEAFFVFDPQSRKVIHTERTDKQGMGEIAGGQGPRAAVVSPQTGDIYVLFRNGIARIDPKTFEITKLADTPVTVGAGIVLEGNKLYFTDQEGPRGGSHLWSYELPAGD